jgi:hypothetical protein
MTTAPRSILVAWLLIATQVALAMNPRGVLLCREADGSVHVATTYSHCCDQPAPTLPPEHPGAECLGFGCEDEQIAPSPAITRLDHPALDANDDDGAAPPPLIAPWQYRPPAEVAQRSLAPRPKAHDAPFDARRARSTILVV